MISHMMMVPCWHQNNHPEQGKANPCQRE